MIIFHIRINKIFEIWLIFYLIVLNPFIALGLGADAISITGRGHCRWNLDAIYTPFHAADVLELNTTLKMNADMGITCFFNFENPSVSDAYGSQQKLNGSYQFFISKNTDGYLEKTSFQVGDLRKLTLGNGLLLKDINVAGFNIKTEFKNFILTLYYNGHGFSDEGDDAVFIATPKDPSTNGIYHFTHIGDNWSDYSLVGYYDAIQILFINVKYELALNSSNLNQFAGMVAPEVSFQDENTKFQAGITGRYYTSAFNHLFTNFEFTKTYYSLFEEDDEFDNWRNYLLNSRLYKTSDDQSVIGINGLIKLDQRLLGLLWIFGNVEYNRQFFKNNSVRTFLYNTGFKLNINEDATIYFSRTNIILNSIGVQEENSYYRDDFKETNNQILSTTNPFWTLGVKFKF